MENDVRYPPVAFYFKVEFAGISGIGENDYRFQEVSGLQMEIEMEEQMEAGNLYPIKMPKKIKYSNLTLKRGLLKDSALIKWLKEATDSYFSLFEGFKKCEIYIHLLNDQNDTLITWHIQEAFPVKWQLSEFKAMDNGLMMETIEFAYKKFEVK